MRDENMIKKFKEATQHLVATQLLNDWEETLNNFLSGDKVSIKNISEVISYMRLLNQKTPIDKLIRIIDSKKYDIETKITIFLTLARFRKEGPELFRKVFSVNLANTFEIELKKYEKDHSRHQQILKYPF
ncbi:MAG: hypothetical protein ACOX6H_03420 [Christensenellales bacterium]|jgi:hypothetical protein